MLLTVRLISSVHCPYIIIVRPMRELKAEIEDFFYYAFNFLDVCKRPYKTSDYIHNSKTTKSQTNSNRAAARVFVMENASGLRNLSHATLSQLREYLNGYGTAFVVLRIINIHLYTIGRRFHFKRSSNSQKLFCNMVTFTKANQTHRNCTNVHKIYRQYLRMFGF